LEIVEGAHKGQPLDPLLFEARFGQGFSDCNRRAKHKGYIRFGEPQPVIAESVVSLASMRYILGDSDLDRRDAAMLATLYMLALRRSELVEIDYEARGDGLELELLRSKTSQEQPVIVAVDRNHNPRAFAALERWLDHAEITPGTPLFRRIRPRGGIGESRVTADGVNRAIKSALARYYELTGTDRETARRLAKRFSGHSGRVGFVVAAKEAGAADSDIAATTRHKSLHMIKRYGETADQRRRAPHRLPGVGL
jgi:integrase